MDRLTLHRARYLLPISAPPLEDGALLAAGGAILAVGRFADLAAAQPAAVVADYGEAVILPPLVNAHTHLELTDFPAWATAAGEDEVPADFVAWIQRVVRVRRTVDSAAVRNSLRAGLDASLAAGTGAVGDILTSLDAVGAYARSPLAGRVFAEVLGVDPERVAARLADIDARLGAEPGPALAWGLSPHAPYTLNAGTLGLAIELAKARQLPLAMHWAETAEEVAFVAHASGPLADRLYPAAGWVPSKHRVTSPAALPAGSLLVHGVHVAEVDVAALAAAGHAVVLCPRSNAAFGVARAPVTAYRRGGVELALGTDSRASSPSLSVWDELAFARRWFAGALDPEDWLEIATRGGARALGLDGCVGRLQAGREASFQVVGVPDGATLPTLAEALCGQAGVVGVQALCLRGRNVLRRAAADPIMTSPH